MKITDILNNLKNYHKGGFDDKESKDKVLYGNTDIDCTGIVTTVWPSIEVIKETKRRGANLIICHEALFWNRGDHTDWLEDTQNKTYLYKKKLLDEYGIVVWRNHDYIHSGIPLSDGRFVDGIFYGLFQKLGWNSYKFDVLPMFAVINVPKIKTQDFVQELLGKLNVNGARVYGDVDSLTSKVAIPYHILGSAKQEIEYIDKNDIDTIIAMEVVDFTLSEYIVDSNQYNKSRTMISLGHFNVEESGMEYMLTYLNKAIKDEKIKCSFVQSGNMYNYL